jgi:hypothetical protein
MRKLEQLIADWRQTMTRGHSFGKERLEELETHLRETIEQLLRSGMNETEAFRTAVAQLGPSPAISSEFRKLDRRTWLPMKMIIGAEIVLALAMTALLTLRMANESFSLLLATHVFTITLGYSTVFLIGALGVCFVCQRCFADFSVARQQSISRLTFVLSAFATCFTAIGIVLGMIWASAEWGRFWAWDPKETGGACVLAWLLLFTIAHQFQRTTGRGLLLLSLLGNIVVSIAWFGGNLVSGLQSYGVSHYNVVFALTAGVVANLAFFLIGLAPAGCLRKA